MVAMAGLAACAPVPTSMGLESTSVPRLFKRAVDLRLSPLNPHISAEQHEAIAKNYHAEEDHYSKQEEIHRAIVRHHDTLADNSQKMVNMYKELGPAFKAEADHHREDRDRSLRRADQAHYDAQDAHHAREFFQKAGLAHNSGAAALSSEMEDGHVERAHGAWSEAVGRAELAGLASATDVQNAKARAEQERNYAHARRAATRGDIQKAVAQGNVEAEQRRRGYAVDTGVSVKALAKKFEEVDFDGGIPNAVRAGKKKLSSQEASSSSSSQPTAGPSASTEPLPEPRGRQPRINPAGASEAGAPQDPNEYRRRGKRQPSAHKPGGPREPSTSRPGSRNPSAGPST
ncbi:hypothetical protein FRC14_002093 [Serendipita sp. 396]|nr:hypothetical protein FRC14_002093 [Serendipita sp. 396]KAG8782860.1 hypothetical protein FRC15_006154 [Serendipita sp. 397]KAG8811506.1 hypothetical protein FRC18_003441 [Serendipita sp. 400]KAG8849430.1 hypothetical protein FRB91_009968 [Serendipita sp. 411]KAG8867161.1 hypothetical protein FRC20_006561 [Serendipita sp. 405]